MTPSERLAELRAWYGTVSGKLAAGASALAFLFAYVSQDPSLAFLISTYLPPPLNWIAMGLCALVAYVLPFWAVRKDARNGE